MQSADRQSVPPQLESQPSKMDVDLDEIDLSALEGELAFTTAPEPVSAEIAAVFPDPLPLSDTTQDFFAVAQAEAQAKPQAAAEVKKKSANQIPTAETERPDEASFGQSKHNTSNDDRSNGGGDRRAPRTTKNEMNDMDGALGGEKTGKKKKKRGKKGAAAAASGADSSTQAEVRRAELRDKLRNRMSMQHELGGKAKLLNNMGVTMNDIAESAKEEASGKRVSPDKQDAVLGRAKNMFSSVFKGMDSKQKSYLSRKTEEVSGMATDLMKKLLSGPGKSTNTPKKSTRSKKKKASDNLSHASAQPAPDTAAAAATETSADDAQKGESDAPELTSTLDPQLEDFVRSVHEKPTKKTKTRAAADAKLSKDEGELPLRARVTKGNVDSKTPHTEAVQSKNQLKNKRKRQKIKDKLKQLKNSDPNSAPAKNTSQIEDIPQLVPIS